MFSQRTSIVLVLCCVLPRYLAATLVLGLLLLSGSPGTVFLGGLALFAVLWPALFFCLCGILVPLAYLVPWLLSRPPLPPRGVVSCDPAVAEDVDGLSLAAPIPPSGGFSVASVASCSVGVVSAPCPLPPACGDGLSERLSVASVAPPTEGLSAPVGAVPARPPLPPVGGDGHLEHFPVVASVAPPTEGLSAPFCAGSARLPLPPVSGDGFSEHLPVVASVSPPTEGLSAPAGAVPAPFPLPPVSGDGSSEHLPAVTSVAPPTEGLFAPVGAVPARSPPLPARFPPLPARFPPLPARFPPLPALFPPLPAGWASPPFPLGGVPSVAPVLGGSLVVPPVSPVVSPPVEAAADGDVPGLALVPVDMDQDDEDEDDRAHGDVDDPMGIQEEVVVSRGISLLGRRARRRRLMALPLGVPARRLAGPYIIPCYMGSSSIGKRRRDTKTGALVEDMDCQ